MKFSLSQMFPWFGTLDAKEDIASKLAESKFQEFLAHRLSLFRDVKEAYFPLIELNEHIRLQQENLSLLTSYKELATIQFANGKGTMVDVLRIDVRIEDVKSELLLLNEKMNPLQVRFNLLLNRSSDEVIELDSLNNFAGNRSFSADSIFVNNPTIASFDLKMNAITKQGEFSLI